MGTDTHFLKNEWACCQRGIIQKVNKVELRFLCTALRDIARNMHIKYGVIRTYGDKVMLQTRNAL